MSEIELTPEQAALYPACVRFVSEQPCGEWGQEMIYADARKLVLVMDDVRQAARERALDEAAEVADEMRFEPGRAIADAIRKLKESDQSSGGLASSSSSSSTSGAGSDKSTP